MRSLLPASADFRPACQIGSINPCTDIADLVASRSQQSAVSVPQDQLAQMKTYVPVSDVHQAKSETFTGANVAKGMELPMLLSLAGCSDQ